MSLNPIITELDFPVKSNLKIRSALFNFVKKNSLYKKQFLQSRYNTAFDGYSYIGQKDSLNQYENDMLHSFVISEFQDSKDFPEEFHSFLKEDWKELITIISKAELAKIKELNINGLKQLYKDNTIGYMMSCNYYPKTFNCESNAKNNTRLSAHKNASLFTTFPYGVDNGLSILGANNNYVEIDKKGKTFLFSGYFLKFMTHKKIPALIEAIFKEQLTEFLLSEEDVKRYFDGSHNIIREKEHEIEVVKQKIETLNTKITKLFELHEKGQIETERFKEFYDKPNEEIKQLKRKIPQLEGEIFALKDHFKSSEYIIEEARSLYKNWNTFTKEQKREIIEIIVEKIIVDDQEITINLNYLMPPSSKKAANGQHNQ